MVRSRFENLHSLAALSRFFIVAAGGLAADLWTKSLAVSNLKESSPINFIPGWIQLEYTENHGAVFGIAQGQRWIFLLVSVAALIFLTYLFTTSGRRPFYQVILGLLLAGVLGNLYDRIAFGYVRDMIHGLPGWHWPHWLPHLVPVIPADVFPWIFNVADSLLCVGVGLMLIYSLFHSPHAPPAAPLHQTEVEPAK
jgi:signal peptidase II